MSMQTLLVSIHFSKDQNRESLAYSIIPYAVREPGSLLRLRVGGMMLIEGAEQ
jgi:hypothetical protein